MPKKLSEIAEFVGGEVVGNRDTLVKGACGIKEAREGDITFVANSRYLNLMETTRAAAVITGRDVVESRIPIVRTDNPSLAFAKIISWLVPDSVSHPKGQHSTVVVGKNVTLGESVSLGAYVVIGDNVVIGDGTIIYSGCFIGSNSFVGKNCLFYPNISIREKISIGDRVIIHSGTVIGSDGFGFANIKGEHHKIPQIGTVEVRDDVEIGANVTIDRARFDKTIIGKGTKIDNLVQIAHNVIIGENSIIVAQAGISGSTVIGNNVILAGQAGLVGHITVGDGAVVAAQAGVTKAVPSGVFVSGYPAQEHRQAKRVNACLQKLPELYKTVAELKKQISELIKTQQ